MRVKKDGPSGILLIDKAAGITSFEALSVIKKQFATPKIGHTGTLDKFATGLLVVLAGWALKLSPWFLSCAKCYEGTIRFGAETDTLDPEGEIVAKAPAPDAAALEAALDRFRGEIMQKPPAYSALHVNGKRAHELARAAKAGGGEAPEMPARSVTIYELTLLSYSPPDACVRVRCSGGTYIRSLARDVALAAGSRAHLAALRRTGVAGFSVEDAVSTATPQNLALRPVNRETFDALGIPSLETGAEGAAWLRNGKSLAVFFEKTREKEEEYNHRETSEGTEEEKREDFRAAGKPDAATPLRSSCPLWLHSSSSGSARTLAVFAPGGELAAVLERDGGIWKYGAVMAEGRSPA